ncbi:MAG: Adenylate cyclase 1 [candidate division WS6 bacterium OLB20]|uniref:Adenylate cyclase 1 n=1 Tax=candidate division WS6 bacterium OLB20 TaxID=1617426 RepID=A0A136M158_9BACT|nr:MAG: Adenylate cyclase 1 [candidate division WS6 bacterium OLB20]
MFYRYLNEPLLNILIEDTSRLSLGGESRDMSVLFSDIRGFTSISEKMSSRELITMVNDYLHFMTDIILSKNGTIDKYIGDAIMAFWNAPVDDAQHAINAVLAALTMQERLEIFNRDYPQYPEIAIGIGINSGDMTVGNVGGEQRFDYTVLGDNVNLGSRLEGLTKKYGVTCIVSESTKKAAEKQVHDDSVLFRLIDNVIVKGREKPIRIYQPLRNTPKNKQLLSDFSKAYDRYCSGDFTRAAKLLQIIDDPVARLYEERIREIGEPPGDWTSVWEWTEK